MADYNSSYTGAQIDANLALAATAVQDADLATVATTGAYSDLTGKPTLGTAAATAAADYATAAQGALADSATQPGDDAADLGSGAATDGYVLTADGAGGAAWEAAAGGGGTPGGSDTQVQFNDGGAFGGDSGFTFDKTNNTLGPTGATITADDPIIDMAQTWNNGAVTFTALKANVTSTASAAASLLMDLQVGGVSLASVRKDGRLTLSQTQQEIATQNTLSFILVGTSSNPRYTFAGAALQIGSAVALSWRDNAASNSGTADLLLLREAANTLAQRNGTAAQAFNLYNTHTDASNYERGFMRWASNTLRIGTDKLGTGTARNLEFQVDGVTRMSINTGGSVVANTAFYGATGSTYFGWTNNALMTSPSVGVIRLNNFAETDFNRLQFGGTTSSFPAIKRSTTSLQARLADDSAFTNIQGKLTTEANAVSETITATHTITLYDAAGTAYKVPCVAA